MIKIVNEKRTWGEKEVEVKTLFGVGNFTNNVELREVETKNGLKSVIGGMNQSMAFNYWANGKEETIFFEISAWGKTAENLAKLDLKGARAAVIGRADKRTYTSKKDGLEKEQNVLTIEEFTITNYKEPKAGEGAKKETKKEENTGFEDFTPVEDFGDDDIPF